MSEERTSRYWTNFYINDYVHLTYENALLDPKVSGSRTNGAATARAVKNTRKKKMEADFKSTTGMSSSDFMEAAYANADNFELMSDLLNLNDLGKIEGLFSDEKLKKIQAGGAAASLLASSAKISGYSNVLLELSRTKTNEQTEQAINNVLGGLDALDVYGGIRDKLTRASSKEAEKQAIIAYILVAMGKEVENIQVNSSGFSGKMKLNDEYINSFTDNLKELKKLLENPTMTLKDLTAANKKIKNGRTIYQQLRGITAGESNSAVLVDQFIGPILEKSLKDTTTSMIQMTGTKGKEALVCEVNIGGGTSKGVIHSAGMKDTLSFKTMNKTADITLTLGRESQDTDTKVKISTKRYSNDAYAIQLASSSIGKLLLGTTDSTILKKYTSGGRAAPLFYNAMHFYLSGTNYAKINGPDESTMYATGSLSSSEVNNGFKDIITEFTLDIYANTLCSNNVTFMDINGLFIPTPIYYEYMMSKLLDTTLTHNNVSSYITFNKSKYNKDIITDSLVSGAPLAKTGIFQGKYLYDSAAMRRNVQTKQTILLHNIKLTSTNISLANHREALLNNM